MVKNENNHLNIVIVNWNSGDQLYDCIGSIKKNPPKCSFGITVVDNFSQDNSLNFLSENTDVSLIKCTSNFGFGFACNLGLSNNISEYVLFLNPDALVYENTLNNVLDYMSLASSNNVGICGVQLVDSNGCISQSCSRFPTSIGFFFHAIGLDRFFPKLGHFMAEWAHDSSKDVDHVIGAFYFIRHKLFEELVGFDARFFVYLEDLDFSYRAHQAGWRSVYLADVQAFHAGGGTSNQVKAKRLFYSLRSRLLYAFKHFPLLGALLVLFATLLIEPISRTVHALSRRSISSLAETWSAYGMLFSWLPLWIFKGVTR